ncbi:MAG: TadE family protein [Bacillota bacterium]
MKIKLMRQSEGSATLELTVILPTMMAIFFSLVFFSMHVYEKAVVLDAATYTVAQASSTWDNTHKELEDGYLPVWSNDGLYWRILNDSSGSALALEKTGYARSFLTNRLEPGIFKIAVPSQPNVDVKYRNSVIRRTITASVNASLFSPASPILRPMLGDKIDLSIKADVAEPVEFIRNCDLGGDYLNKIADYLGVFGQEEENQNSVVLVGSTYSYSEGNSEKLYHYPGCPYIGKIKQKREFKSVREAKAEGYHLCIKCAQNKRKQLENTE